MVLWRRRSRIARHSSPRAMILKVCIDAAYGVALQGGRHRQELETSGPADDLTDSLCPPWEALARREFSGEILNAVNRLSRRQAVATTLRVFDELPYEQIAAAMRCSAATARKHVERALAQGVGLAQIRSHDQESNMNIIDENTSDDRNREGVSEGVPPDVEVRLRARLAEFRSGIGPARAITSPTGHRWPRPARWGIGITRAAAVVFLAMAPWVRETGASIAQVANAVRQQPWIHMRTVYGDRSVHEEWYAPSRLISASSRPRSIEYRDDRLQVYETYDPEETVVYRGPAYGRPRGAKLESRVKALGNLLQKDRVPDRPLEHLSVLGPDRTRMKVLEQAVN